MRPDSLVDDVRDRQRLNAVIQSYLDRPTWTAAEAVLLMYGVLPEPGCNDISRGGRDIRNPAAKAIPGKGFNMAKKLLERWIDEQQEDSETELTAATEVRPWGFLTWAHESYEDDTEMWKPDWLSYFMSFTRGYSGAHKPNVPAAVPMPYVDCASALVTLKSLSDDAEKNPERPKQSAGDRVIDRKTEHRITQRGRQCRASEDILTAMMRLEEREEDKFSTVRVWVELCVMVKAGQTVSLQPLGEEAADSLPFKRSVGGGGFKRRQLTRFLNHRKNVKIA